MDHSVTDVLKGIFPVLPTPFTTDGDVDIDGMLPIVDYARQSGVAGVVFPGFASEVEHLNANEREALLSKLVEGVEGAMSVVAGASGKTAADVIGYGQKAQALGLNWLMIQHPKSIGSDAADVIKFFSEITSALPDTRIVLQNAPAPRGSDLSPSTILEVIHAIRQVSYVKEETLPAGPAITEILAGKPDHLLGVIGGGGARYILDEYQRGACAAMPALEIAGEHVALDKAWWSGDKETARDLYVRTLPLLTLQAVYRMRLTKYILMRRGVLSNVEVRSPTAQLDSVAIADIDTNLIELGIIDAVTR